MFKLSATLIEENDKIKNHNSDLKDYNEFMVENNKTLKFKITNIRNSNGTYETCVSMKKKVN